MSTTFPKDHEVDRKWHLVDVAGKPLGVIAVEIAALLRGRYKVDYAPHVDMGDFVVVVNSAAVKLSGNKENQKIYKHYTGYPGGYYEFKASTVRAKNPNRMIEQAVHGMLPKGRLGRTMNRRLKVYPGGEHPHGAQQPQPFEAKI